MLLAPDFCMLVGLDIIPTNDADDYELQKEEKGDNINDGKKCLM